MEYFFAQTTVTDNFIFVIQSSLNFKKTSLLQLYYKYTVE